MVEDGWWCVVMEGIDYALCGTPPCIFSPIWGSPSAYAAEECHLLQRRACADGKCAVV